MNPKRMAGVDVSEFKALDEVDPATFAKPD